MIRPLWMIVATAVFLGAIALLEHWGLGIAFPLG